MQATIHNEFLTLTVDTHGAEAVSLKNAAGEELLWLPVQSLPRLLLPWSIRTALWSCMQALASLFTPHLPP